MNFWHINNLGQALRKVKETSLKRFHMSDSIYMTFWNVKLIVIETDEWLSGLRGRGRMVPREGRTREAQERPRAWLWCTLPRSVPWLCRWSNEPARVLTPRTARQMKCQFHSHNCNTKKISKELIIVMLNGKSVGRDHKGPDTLLGAASSEASCRCCRRVKSILSVPPMFFTCTDLPPPCPIPLSKARSVTVCLFYFFCLKKNKVLSLVKVKYNMPTHFLWLL